MEFSYHLTVISVVEIPPKLLEHRSLQHFAETQEEDYCGVMCIRVDVVQKFAAIIIKVDGMMEAAGFSETSVHFYPIRGVTAQKQVFYKICNFHFIQRV
jgi:hypothetical protein